MHAIGIKGPGDGARERPKIADATATPSLAFPHATLLSRPSQFSARASAAR